MKTQILSLIAALSFSSVASAASTRLEMVGEGSASAPAEFLKVQIQLSSVCHATSLTARQEVQALSRRAQEVLAAHQDLTVENQLQVHPGSNTREERVEYRRNTSVLLCEELHGWGSSELLVFKLSKISEMDNLQDAILSMNDAIDIPNSGDINKVVSKITLSAPQPGVFANTYDRLTDESLQNAHKNALRQAKLFANGSEPTLTKVQPTQDSSGGVSYDRTDLGGNASAAEKMSITVRVARKFTFNVIQ